MRTRIKLCGFRSLETVQAACQAGADAIGFVFYPQSPRYIDPVYAKGLVQYLGAWQTPVALFVNPEPIQVHEVLRYIPHAVLQFHGEETPELCESFSRPYIKAIRMRLDIDLKEESKRYSCAQALLLDSWSHAYGGTGHTFDWSLLPKAGQLSQPLVLSGGLDVSNVAQAIAHFKPYGVDVSSGIESERGIKNSPKIFEFCKAVYMADAASIEPQQEQNHE